MVPLFPKSPLHFEIQGHAYSDHHRNHEKNKQGQRQVNSRQYEKCDQYLDSRNKKFLRAVMGKFRHVEQVVRDPPHNLPHLRIVIIGVGKLLQMKISIPAHIRLDLRSHDMPHIGHIIAGNRIDDAQSQIKQSQARNRPHRKFRQAV